MSHNLVPGKQVMEITPFERAYNEIRIKFNMQKGRVRYSTSSEISQVDTSGINILELAAVTLLLVHNLEKNHPLGLNIDTLQTFDLDTLTDHSMFQPYIEYIIEKKHKSSEKRSTTDPLYANYVACMVRYLWIAQQRGVSVVEQ